MEEDLIGKNRVLGAPETESEELKVDGHKILSRFAEGIPRGEKLLQFAFF
jgi:hypothetical protein